MSVRSKVFFALALALCVLMPGAQSLWIDEAQTWRVASMPSFGAFLSDLTNTHGSEAMMPFGMLMPWLAARVLGTGEWQLRAVNILWAAAAVGAFFVLGRRWRMPWAPLFMAVQPFLWFYANEARPYALQIAAGAWLLVGLVVCVEDRRIDRAGLLILLISSGILIATVLFGVLTAGPVCLLVAWLAWRGRWPLPKGWRIAVAVALLWSALFGAYYLRSVARGASGARLWDVGMQNITFTFYEFAGFSGLSLSRNEIRELAQTGGARAILHACPPLSLAAVAALALAYLTAAVSLLRGAGKETRRMVAMIGGPSALSGGALVLLAFVAHFPFWGRHLAPIFPFFCALLILALRDLSARRPAFAAALVTFFFVLLPISSWALRTSPRHAKDDYRTAVAIARRAVDEGRIVWWCADPFTARYYGLPITEDRKGEGPAVYVSLMTAEALAGKPPPDLIIISKPDAFDMGGLVTAYAKERGFLPVQRLNVFAVLAPAPAGGPR